MAAPSVSHTGYVDALTLPLPPPHPFPDPWIPEPLANPPIISCAAGFEAVVAAELQELGYRACYLKSAKLVVPEASLDACLPLIFYGRTLHRVYLLLGIGRVKTLNDVRDFAQAISFQDYLHPSQRFAVRAQRHGTHPFTSMDVAREVGTAVVDRILAHTGQRIRADLETPDVEIMAELSDDQLLLLLNASGPPLHRRHRRAFQHFAPLLPTLAAALLRLSDFPSAVDLLIDPMAGGGTIPIEAALMARQIAPGLLLPEEHLVFFRLPFFDAAGWHQLRQQATCQVRPRSPVPILAADRFARNVRGMQANLAAMGVAADVSVHAGNAERMTYLEGMAGGRWTVVTNPPYGLRLGDPRRIDQLYRDFAQACARYTIGEIVALTPRRDSWLNAFAQAGYHPTLIQPVRYGRLEAFVLRVELAA
ncbi:THUMP domain-containing class I SAM-dependent RNA methyltransferase [Rhodothermus profundi]|uniref:Putative N6-adenine-specific DNA methylase n=1 Tax=Rhodothermus profundi TaxID=633813 RepID=A0A1M6SRS9_9BACT|nr:THUMP domain-containing protein [Rhodothermus profundi]SHK47298.1 putative N6-adenine-specific DNA methylase [Rhodothermus profundi]